MPRWYALFWKKYDKPAKIRANVDQLVKTYDAGRIVTRINFEKKSSGNGGSYFALGIESETPGQIPDPIADWIRLPALGNVIRDEVSLGARAFQREELAKWMGDAAIEDYARILRFARPDELSPDDPFANPTQVDALSDDDIHLERSQQYDSLLTWISVMGSGSLTQLRSATVALGLSAPEDGTSRILRRLRLLGHIETSPDGKRWSVAPIALVESADDPESFFLAGARDQALLTTLRNFGHIKQTTMAQGDGPSHVCVRLGDARMIDYTPSLRPYAAGRAGERIATVLPDIDSWVSTLQQVSGLRPERYELHRYDGEQFRPVAMPRQDGLYQFYDESGKGDRPAGDPKFSLYFDATRQHWYRGDWYGLRYLAEVRRRGTMPACYDASTRQLAVFRDQRWPELYERSAVLASGQLPRTDGPWLVYDGVSQTLMDLLADRLHLDVDGDSRDA